MKTSDSISPFTSRVPSLFQIAAFFEDFFPGSGWKQPSTASLQVPFAEYMVNPEKLMNLLKSGKTEVQAAVVADRPMKRAAVPKKPASQSSGKPSPSPTGSSKQIEFTFRSPLAHSVKLVGDFTNWENGPVDMKRSEEDIWQTVVSLGPGLYSYRFIVDGKWCDDPRSKQRIPNPFGGENAVIHVV